jgi:hypothetical protein
VLITSSTPSLKAGETAVITFTFSEDVGTSFEWNGSTGDVRVTGGSLSALSGTGLTRTAVFTPNVGLSGTPASITLDANSYADSSGNLGTAGLSPAITLNTLAASVVSAILSSATGAQNSLLNGGDTLTATLVFSEAITLNALVGSPTLALQIGSATVQATYAAGSGTNTYTFTTSIASGQTDTNGVSIAANGLSLNGSTLLNSLGNATTLLSSAISDNANYLVDTTAPTLTITADKANLRIGETAVIAFTFSEDPGSTFTWNGTVGDLTVTGGSLGALSGTGQTRQATFTQSSVTPKPLG